MSFKAKTYFIYLYVERVHDVEEENIILKENCHKLQSTLDELNKEKKQVEKRCIGVKYYRDIAF